MTQKTRGEVEAAFTSAMLKLEKEYFGREPVEVQTHIFSDMILIRLKKILTQAEIKMAHNQECQVLIKETRRQLFEASHPLIEKIVKDILNCSLISIHTDLSTKTGDRVVVLVVDRDLDQDYPA